MEERRGKAEINIISITSDLIIKLSKQKDFSKINSLTFQPKAGKIKVNYI